MIVKKKIRDFEEYDFINYIFKNCPSYSVWGSCTDCKFYNVMCNVKSDRCWVKHKNLYSNEFLDQELEIDVPEILNEIDAPEILDEKEKDLKESEILYRKDKIK